jgi:hypothetical protein
MPACLATSVAFAPGSINAATHVSFSERDQRRRLSTEVMTSIRFMALWLSLVLATLSYAKPPRSQGGASRTDTGQIQKTEMHLAQSRRPPSLACSDNWLFDKRFWFRAFFL